MPTEEYNTLTSRFTDILNASTPDTTESTSAHLLTVIKSTPTSLCVEALAFSIVSVTRENPKGVDTYVLSAKHLLESKDAQLVNIEGWEWEPASLDEVFKMTLAEFVKDGVHETALNVPKHTDIVPSNPCLTAALLSASAIKYGLLKDTKASYAFTRQGLQLPDSRFDAPTEKERQQVVSVGACLHLSIAGQAMMQRWLALSDGHDAVLRALKSLREKKIIAFPRGVNLLEATIANAENQFIHDSLPADAWEFLFPEK